MLNLKIGFPDLGSKMQSFVDNYFYPFVVGFLMIFLLEKAQTNEHKQWQTLFVYPENYSSDLIAEKSAP